MRGTYLEVTPPERTVHTEAWGPEWPETINTTAFTEAGARTVVTLTIKYPSKEARDGALATGMTTGMDASFNRLDTMLHTLS